MASIALSEIESRTVRRLSSNSVSVSVHTIGRSRGPGSGAASSESLGMHHGLPHVYNERVIEAADVLVHDVERADVQGNEQSFRHNRAILTSHVDSEVRIIL